jgi:uncharacterized membrane protein
MEVAPTYLRTFLRRTAVGALIILPAYLAVLLLLKGMASLAGLISPLTHLLPGTVTAGGEISFLIVVLICWVVGVLIRTRSGASIRRRLESYLLEWLPGYELIRSLTQRLTGRGEGHEWKPALAEIQDALVPSFVIEELADGRFTIFVPSVPTPVAGAVYIIDRARVHLLDVPFTKAVASVSRWGSGSKELVEAMQKAEQ